MGAQLSVQQRARLEAAIAEKIDGRVEAEYLRHLSAFAGAAELSELMGTLLVHRTEVYRDVRQLETIQAKVLPRLLAKKQKLDVWSAGCATGEEVATLLIMLAEAGAAAESLVLGSDASQGALHLAQTFTYSAESMKHAPSILKGRYFRQDNGRFQLVGQLAARSKFVRHNLMDFPYPLPDGGGGFDLILCRNVLIYFTEPAAEKVLLGLAERLKPNGVLVLGAAEPLNAPAGLQLWREEHAFFHVKGDPPSGARVTSLSGFFPPVTAISPSPTGEGAAKRRVRGEEPAHPSSPPPPSAPRPSRPSAPLASIPPTPTPQPSGPDEGADLFRSLLDKASHGEMTEQTEADLRKCLYLSPGLAPARYLLGVLLEQKGQRADAAAEYRRAVRSSRDRHAPKVEFFLNPHRLERACYVALDRLGYPRE